MQNLLKQDLLHSDIGLEFFLLQFYQFCKDCHVSYSQENTTSEWCIQMDEPNIVRENEMPAFECWYGEEVLG